MVRAYRAGSASGSGREKPRRNRLVTLAGWAIASAIGYAGLTGAAIGPASGDLGALGLPGLEPVRASLSLPGRDAVLTGSLDHMFSGLSFSGPNRAEKTDRARPQVALADIVTGFEATRLHIASLRASELADPAVFGQSSVAVAEADEEGPRISVASLGTAPVTSALSAIEGATTGGPVPQSASDQLAYARATAPISDGVYVRGPSMQVADQEQRCLATAIYFEARGESYRGQVAVAQTVLNRVKDHRYPSTICGVVYQGQHRRNACQFSFACDGIPDRVSEPAAWAQSEEIANKVLGGEIFLAEVGAATHYHATYVSPPWAPRMNRLTQIGLHVFYEFKSGWAWG